jgi:NAD(P)-dependent dehydrogenase (short-subunit alcohol dehydrogenase family)
MNIKNLFDMKGKTALVTGGGQGIGRAICMVFAEYGANVIINYRTNYIEAEDTYKNVLAYGVKAWLWKYDLNSDTITKDYKVFMSEADTSVDILVLNASIQIRKEWNRITLEEFNLQININLRASLELIQCCVPEMIRHSWGRILTLGSVQQYRSNQQMTVYAASKMGQYNMVRNLVPQLAPYHITINNLAPGVITTGRNKEVLSDVAYKEKIEKNIPLGFIGDVTDVVPMALLLCSEAGRYITGTDILVDGGMSLPC